MSPFAHAIVTGTTGLILGFAARRWHTGMSVAAFFVGLVPAMFLHSMWNSMGQDFLVQYILVQVPIFVLAVVAIVLLRVAENRLTRQRLKEYAAAGWFTPPEVAMLATRQRPPCRRPLGKAVWPGPANEVVPAGGHRARLHPATDPERPRRPRPSAGRTPPAGGNRGPAGCGPALSRPPASSRRSRFDTALAL
jgi:hypothetical protein